MSKTDIELWLEQYEQRKRLLNECEETLDDTTKVISDIISNIEDKMQKREADEKLWDLYLLNQEDYPI